VEGAGLVRRALTVLLLLALAAAGQAGCASKEHPDTGGPLAKPRDCADLLGRLTNLEFDPKATAAKADRMVRQLDEAIKGIDSADVKRAANDLLLRVRRWRDAVRAADPARERRALRGVTDAAERLARTCNVPVDQVTTAPQAG
jgi:hypothetical protein